jgi:hypothetical protein
MAWSAFLAPGDGKSTLADHPVERHLRIRLATVILPDQSHLLDEWRQLGEKIGVLAAARAGRRIVRRVFAG